MEAYALRPIVLVRWPMLQKQMALHAFFLSFRL